MGLDRMAITVKINNELSKKYIYQKLHIEMLD